jgi:hypothetical protein
MEVITLGGLAVLAVGGYYFVIDFMNDLGIGERRIVNGLKKLPVSQRYAVATQTGIKKMAGMHI